ncbi:MAG: hypothetical protein U9O98_00655 [Asgard group archaeon]|nr:hypothetical protein [Asgard group archaeon]
MNNEKTEKKVLREIKFEKILQTTKKIFQILAYIVGCGSIVLFSVIWGLYGFDATSNDNFAGKTLGIIGIPLFSIALLSALIIGIIDFREHSLKEEEERKEFKITSEEKLS